MLLTGWLKAFAAATPWLTRATWASNGIRNGHPQGRPWSSRWVGISSARCANTHTSCKKKARQRVLSSFFVTPGGFEPPTLRAEI